MIHENPRISDLIQDFSGFLLFGFFFGGTAENEEFFFFFPKKPLWIRALLFNPPQIPMATRIPLPRIKLLLFQRVGQLPGNGHIPKAPAGIAGYSTVPSTWKSSQNPNNPTQNCPIFFRKSSSFFSQLLSPGSFRMNPSPGVIFRWRRKQPKMSGIT